MRIKTEILMSPIRVSLSFTFLLFTTASGQPPIYMYNFCENSTLVSSSYRSNVESLLSWVTTDSFKSDGYNFTTVNSNSHNNDDDVYGLYSCRYDMTGYFCQFCITTAASELSRRCPNAVRAIIWYDICIIRYSNQSFNAKVSLTPTWNITGPRIIKDSSESRKAVDSMNDLIWKATVETKKFWAVEEFDWVENEKRYGWVQCDRDIKNDECGDCLHALLDIFPDCCSTHAQWAIFGPSCGIRMDDEKFYQTSGNGGSTKSRKLIISFSVLGSVVLLCFSVYCFWYRKRVRRDKMMFDEEKLNGDLPIIPLIAVLHSTNNFSEESKLGEGGFGPVYKGILPDGRQIAVKRLSKFSGQGSQEFKNEVMFIAKLQHRNLVRLLGCCLEENENILVYEYMCNASLDSHLFGGIEKRKQLDWKLRLSIINGIAKGILYLHEDSRLKVIHRDLKGSNVLLDHEMNPKISDFGLARAFEIGQNQANTKRVVGTYGYMAPEYAMEGLFSVKSDVFSFGVIVLEIICGRKNSGFHRSEHGQSLLLYAWNIWCEGRCLELMDPALIKSFIASEVVKCIHVGLLCVQQDAADRPTMSTVVLMLGSDTMTLPKPNHPAYSVGRLTSNDASTSRSSKNLSINDVTFSTVLAR
ncbi:cysteine-rich receptor-like protein kinase 25 [Vigna unguiculata]|uniref:cysteine-rich receptor-like protein kinase 25 n=1 Tax=Vigna unguiculata TaxID=3917 RepID=UPI001015E99C|nr:cysteine-rich receptor-like protein kinase 25 [Vigna unguiculata]